MYNIFQVLKSRIRTKYLYGECLKYYHILKATNLYLFYLMWFYCVLCSIAAIFPYKFILSEYLDDHIVIPVDFSQQEKVNVWHTLNLYITILSAILNL